MDVLPKIYSTLFIYDTYITPTLNSLSVSLCLVHLALSLIDEFSNPYSSLPHALYQVGLSDYICLTVSSGLSC